jgi:glucose-6-phosphate isomerase
MIMRGLGPIWNANETWLLVAAGTAFGAFPVVYSLVLNALFVPVMFTGVGLIIRAVAFPFYEYAKQKKLCTVVISKSGNTIETLSAFFHLQKYLDPKGYIIITDPKKGTLRELAEKNKWLSFEVPPTVGGRYSVLTPVGFVPAAFAGINISKLVEGQLEIRAFLENSKEENPALALAQYKYSLAEKGFNIQYFMPYLQCLKYFSEWYVQLFAESLGKESKGPTPVAALGPSDQHSILQLIKEGPKNKVVVV